MNKEEILALEAETADPAIIAVEVMGWHKNYSTMTWVDSDGILVAFISSWNPWKDISAAMQVLDELKKDWDCITLFWDVGAWDIILESYDISETFCLGKESGLTYKELPEAICRIALLSQIRRKSR